MKMSKDQYLYLIENEDGSLTLSLTPQAQDEFGAITFVNLPKVGTLLNIGDSFAEVEAEKAVNELVSPVAGVVSARHDAAMDDPNLLNDATPGAAWLIQVKA